MSSGRSLCDDGGPLAVREAVRGMVADAGACVCGFTDCAPLPSEAAMTYRRWIAAGKNASMAYAARYTDVREDPRLLLDGAATIICAAFAYASGRRHALFADYALGEDYHDVLRRRLTDVAAAITRRWGGRARACVDTAPLRERYMAAKAGIGIIGDNGLLIVDRPPVGSRVFLAEILWTVPLPPDPSRLGERCRGCGACAAACPGAALDSSGNVDARRCRSYLTIEHRGPFPDGMRLTGRIYGCDICQDVCPYNSVASPVAVLGEFMPSEDLMQTGDAADIAAITPDRFRELFRHSAVRRAGIEGLRRNALAALGSPSADDI